MNAWKHMEKEAVQTLARLYATCEAVEASDIHIVAGAQTRFRLQGRLTVLENEPVLPVDLVHGMGMLLAAESLPEGEDPEALFRAKGSADGAVTSPAGKRYRFNVFREQGRTAIALRRLDDHFRTLAELGLPESLMEFTRHPDGLAIISGATGSGKSTTLATLIDAINEFRYSHIITIEDPVEYLHPSKRALVRQRQIGRDATDFHSALVDALREDPDVILVGEIRDLPTIRTALTAAETGHLVFTTLHAGDCVGAVERLVSVFPSDEQNSVRRQLSLILRGVFAQRLLPKRTEPGAAPAGRIACGELLMLTPAVANLVAIGRSQQIYSAMEVGGKYGMRTLEQDLARLVTEGLVDEAVAMAQTRSPEVLRERIRTARLSRGGTRYG